MIYIKNIKLSKSISIFSNGSLLLNSKNNFKTLFLEKDLKSFEALNKNSKNRNSATLNILTNYRKKLFK